eukprot:CAMPEP_0194774042 /NCGR_PEP_ID=MMETSP0323_2-20130528/56584_1 /TAXON_ID=2866 ORGANISM="Crypthecodinium cohnii, Strain Seligo" /NCGR_SAMPLE_ID=MMETSP0323_2 /ASSEMBLY_ACC=CAM_ASM_000346 /LENGTH=169 /DNA_ID=CAMNT_0039709411 /DNA_START=540 /DNA_END=1049 /DNA_ORIENTATION=+
MPPPFCAVVHSESSLQRETYFGDGCSAASFAFEASIEVFVFLASWLSSRSAVLSIASASSRERTIGLPRTGSKGCPQSRCLTTMCRSRTLSASFLAFLAAGGPPAFSSLGMKCTTTEVHWAEAFWGNSEALLVTSPAIARGLPWNSAPADMQSSGVTVWATGADDSTMN